MSAEQAAQVRDLSDRVQGAGDAYREHKLRCLIPQCAACAELSKDVNDLMRSLAVARANQEDDQ